MSRLPCVLAVSCLTIVAGIGSVRAQSAPASGAAPAAAAPSSADGAPAMPPAKEAVGGAGAVSSTPSASAESDTTTVAGVPMVDAAAQDARGVHYGLGLRGRWATVPSWLLGIFLQEKQSLSSYAVGLEGFRRSGSFDLVLGVGWQALSPPDGNWLGKGKDPATETDYVQFRSLGAVSVDVAFISRTELNPYVFLHYGGGIGIGIITGKMLRTSDGSAGCRDTPGDVTKCHPIICTQGPCTEATLAASEGSPDTAQNPSRFQDHNVPPVYPIVNLITGLDFKIPSAPGLEFKIDLGYFFPYFFLGAGTAYQF
jgi:hypothetical protein